MNDKQRNKKETIYMVLSFLVMAGFFGYSLMKDDLDVKSKLMRIGFVLLIFAMTMVSVVSYWYLYIRKEDKDTTFFKNRRKVRKKTDTYKKTITGKNMYDACRRYVHEENVSDTVIIIFIELIFAGIFLVTTGKAIHWGYYVGIPLVLTPAFYIWSCHKSKEVQMLKTFIANSPYDEIKVNDDFMSGEKHFLKHGLVCVGMQYVVVCHYEAAFVCELSDVQSVQKIAEEYHSGGLADFVTQRYAIKILLKNGHITLPCWDEMGVDLLIEEFKHRGYF